MSLILPHLSLGGSTDVGGLTYLSTLQQLHNRKATLLQIKPETDE